jgi:metallo-beta-lactamase family protein
MQLTFLGATDTVTGSKYLLEFAGKKILIDCGLFQGYKKLRQRNWENLPINPKEIDAIVLTHAHIDHSGYLPLIIKKGFNKTIYSSHSTKELCNILLPDSGYLQEEEARLANKYGYSKHKPAQPLYTKEDAIATMNYFKTIDFKQQVELAPNFSFMLYRAGHILGAAMVQFKMSNKTILFTGDLGRPNDPIMFSPDKIQQTDYLVVESTYGNRTHLQGSPIIKLEEIVNKTISQRGTLIIPAFAVGRAQTMLYYLYQLKKQNRIPNVPVFIDSPMAESATDILQKHKNNQKLSAQECEQVCNVAQYVKTSDESKRLDINHDPKIIISASGMLEGGRVLHHIQAYGSDQKNCILFTGYQAGGTRGAKMLAGDDQVKIHGMMVNIRARKFYITT